jgi:hypothetical protein
VPRQEFRQPEDILVTRTNAEGVYVGLTRRRFISVSHHFCSSNDGFCSDGYDSTATMIFDGQGNIYGTTASGGRAVPNCITCGVVFKLSPTGGVWT